MHWDSSSSDSRSRICINAADESLLPSVKGNFIKQLFILTHNVYFHKAVTQGYEKFYQPVSFYIIRKENEISHIKLCEKRDPNKPTETINDNPVKNDYSLLWDEMNSIKSYPMLMSCMRRILEYYFIQLCGQDGTTLRDRILKDENRQYFVSTDPATGEENTALLNIVSALITQMELTNIVNDGMYYIEDAQDLEQCKESFRLIFHCMGQEDHYKMMMEKA